MNRRGFTLLELLTVVAIMLILMTMAAAAYRGMVRGGSMPSAVSNLRSTLALARQYAVTHRSRTFVIFSQDSERAHWVVYAQQGTHKGNDGSLDMIDSSKNWEESPPELKGGTVHNLTDGSKAVIVNNTEKSIVGALSGGAENDWDVGDKYGWALNDAEHLPPDFLFNGGAYVPETVIFNPDGTTPLRGTGDYVMEITEMHGNAARTVRVQGLTGLIKVE